MEDFEQDDPPPIPQLAVPVPVPRMAYNDGHCDGSSKQNKIGNLTLVAFYFLPRVG